MASKRLKTLAREYLKAREAQESDHTNLALNEKRTKAHDAMMLQMDHEGISYKDREDAAQIAKRIVAGTYRRPAQRRQGAPSRAEKRGQMRLPSM